MFFSLKLKESNWEAEYLYNSSLKERADAKCKFTRKNLLNINESRNMNEM